MMFLVPFLAALGISFAVTPVVRKIALRYGVVDHPTGDRKIHTKPVAYLGGVAIFLGFVLPLIYFVPMSRRLLALLLAIVVLLIVGVIDDMRGLSPWAKLSWQVVAACLALAGGIGIVSITNPFGGVIDLSWGRTAVDFGMLHFNITPIGNLVSLIWMVGVINVVNFLDGLDGLAGGVSAISAFILFLLALKVGQPEVAIIAIILAGAALGWLPFNFFPARIFMGDGGAYFLGITLAMLAIYSGGKLATAALVLGFTIFDGLWVAARRMGRGVSPFAADRQHVHHLLLEAGLSQRQVVLILYAVSALFGLIAVFASSIIKLLLLIMLFALITLVTRLLINRRTTH